MERISCEEPKTFYNVMSGKKIAENVVSYLGFDCGWYSCCFADGRSALYDSDDRLVAEGFDKAEAVETMYLLQKDGVSSLFAADGRQLMQTKGEISLYANGWVETSVNGVKTLYRPDMSLAASDYAVATVMADGAYYLIQSKDEDGTTLFDRKGNKLAKGIESYQFFTPDYYALSFADKTVVYDISSGTSFATSQVLLVLKQRKMFTVITDEHAELYRSDGTLVLTGYDRYEVFANGMYFAAQVNQTGKLFYPDGSIAAEDVFACSSEVFCDFVKVICADKCLLFNEKAEFLMESACDIEVFPNGWFFCGNGNDFDGVLYRKDKSVVQKRLAQATAYGNGWYTTVKYDDTEETSVTYLYDSENNLVAESMYDLEFDEEHLCYILKYQDGPAFMYDANGRELISAADQIVPLGHLIVVERGCSDSLYVFENHKEGVKVRELLWAMVPDFDKIAFCGVEDDEGNSLLF